MGNLEWIFNFGRWNRCHDCNQLQGVIVKLKINNAACFRLSNRCQLNFFRLGKQTRCSTENLFQSLLNFCTIKCEVLIKHSVQRKR
jgi:hypothetical protein